MCGIFGALNYADFIELYQLNRQRGDYSTGITFITNANILQTLKFEGELIISQIPEDAKVYVGHVRAPTQGLKEFSLQDSHPFETESFLLAHNGIVKNDKALRMKFNVKEPQTDSYMIVHAIEQDLADDVSAKITAKVFEMLLKDKASEGDVMKYVKDEKEKIKSQQYAFMEISIPKTITEDFDKYKVKTFHVKAAEWSNRNLGKDFKKGSRVRIIYGHIDGLPSCDAFAFENLDDLQGRTIRINWDKQMKVLVDNKIERGHKVFADSL